MNSPITIGIDLAKEVFAICVLDERGAVRERRVLRRAAFERWAVQAPSGTIAMESCSSAHHWGRWFSACGHTVRLIAPEFVAPFRKGGKNDAADAEAIAVAARQPTMRFVTIKTVEQQAILSWHRARLGWIEERTALINRLRGLLAEFGIAPGRSRSTLRAALPRLTDDAALPSSIRALLLEAREQFAALEARVTRCDAEIAAHLAGNGPARRLRELLGIGPLTASALVATVSNASSFRNGRQFGAWLGLTPQQHSSGGKSRLGKVTRHGDGYLRSLLVQGARSALQSALRCLPDRLSRLGRWIVDLFHRKGYHRTLVAIANKHARMLWAMLAHDEAYDPLAWQRYRAPAASATV